MIDSLPVLQAVPLPFSLTQPATVWKIPHVSINSIPPSLNSNSGTNVSNTGQSTFSFLSSVNPLKKKKKKSKKQTNNQNNNNNNNNNNSIPNNNQTQTMIKENLATRKLLETKEELD